MAETRRLTDLGHGHTGELTYFPQSEETRPGALHTGRITANAPYFKVIGSSAELYPASKSRMPEGPRHLWQERRIQRRWLLKSHPQAFMGNSALQELLEENTARFHKVEGELNARNLLAIGQMTDVSYPYRRVGALMLAAATGESGELLRLARIDESKWQWGDSQDAALQLSVIDPDDQEEEAIWVSDGLPISQIKFATSLSKYDPTRWLLVQKQTSTFILQPQYHKVPLALEQQTDVSIRQRLSRIEPNLIVTISHKQTGGNAHTDVSFNPGTKGNPPQLAIIDECGYWSIWDIPSISKVGSKVEKATLSPSMIKCGHIREGLLDAIPPQPAYPAENHGLFFVGTAEVDSFWGEPSRPANDTEASAVRAQHLLLWNRETFEVHDLSTNTILPKPPTFSHSKQNPGWILDVQPSPVNRNHVFVLTSRHLFWVDLFSPSKEEDDMPPKIAILLTCSHLIDVDSMKLSICRASDASLGEAIVFTYSPQNKQLHAYWFRSNLGQSQWHRQVLTVPGSSDVSSTGTAIQTIEVHPAKLLPLGTDDGPGSLYQRSGVQFYQGSVLDEDLCVRYCIFASFKDRDIKITLPTTRMGQSVVHQAKKWKRKRKRFIRHMGSTFVFPDAITDADMSAVVRSPSLGATREIGAEQGNSAGPVSLKFDHLCAILQGALASTPASPDDGISPRLLSAIQGAMENGVLDGTLPLTTWQDISKDMQSQIDDDSMEDAAQLDIFDLFDRADDETVVTHLGRNTGQESSESLVGLAQLNAYFSRLWLEPLDGKLSESEEQKRRRWLAELAKEVFLSSYGVMVQDTKLLGSGGSGTVEESQRHISSSIPIKASQSSAPSIASSPPASVPTGDPDAAIQRLQLLAPSLRSDKMSGAKQSKVLSYWPAERGISTHDYMSSVAIASDRQFDAARQRLHKIESRRKAQAEKYKFPAFRRQGTSQGDGRRRDAAELPLQQLPMPMQIMSSQQAPSSSQSQGVSGPSVIMSQPVSGAFGDRKRKKTKRKSGFR